MKLLTTLLSCLCLILWGKAILSGNLGQTVFFGVMQIFSLYLVLEALGWFESKAKPQETSSVETSSALPQFLEGPEATLEPPVEHSSEDFKQIAQEQVKSHAPLVFEELNRTQPIQSDLRHFDTLAIKYNDGIRTLVISNFHQRQRYASTLVDHLKLKISFPFIICESISDNIDLIPYAGHLDQSLVIQAQMFLERQALVYPRIIFFLPSDQLETWQSLSHRTQLAQTSRPETSAMKQNQLTHR